MGEQRGGRRRGVEGNIRRDTRSRRSLRDRVSRIVGASSGGGGRRGFREG